MATSDEWTRVEYERWQWHRDLREMMRLVQQVLDEHDAEVRRQMLERDRARRAGLPVPVRTVPTAFELRGRQNPASPGERARVRRRVAA